MVKRLLFLLIVLACFSSCKSSKTKVVTKKSETTTKATTSRTVTNNIIYNALSYEGTPYKYGGTTKRGMDCSGLIYTAFNSENIALPRVSRDMATKGRKISLKDVQKGDLLFFITNKSKNRINHVGLVVKSSKNNIEFIHSTTSKGVITSSLSEAYWNKAFVQARRVL